jgi:hypothetical protein
VTGRGETPPAALDVPVAPLGSSGRGRGSRGSLLAALGVAAALLGAVVLGQLFPAGSADPGRASPLAAVSSTGPGPSAQETMVAPSIDALALRAPPRLTASALAGGVRDGTLDGFLLYADATLVDACEAPGPACRLAVQGLGLEVVPGAPAAGSRPPVPDRAVLVLAVRGGILEYLGSLIVDPDGSPSLSSLPVPPVAVPGQTLFDAAGWLVRDPACVAGDPETPEAVTALPPAPACASLSDDPPRPHDAPPSDRGRAVALAPDPWGVEPSLERPLEGPFLVRVADPGSGHAWEVVARYDPTRSVRVVIP